MVQEMTELERQLGAKEQVQVELNKHRAAQDAQRYLKNITSISQETVQRLQLTADELEGEFPPLGSRVDAFPEKAYRELTTTVRRAAEAFHNSMESALTRHTDWEKVRSVIHQAEEGFKTACGQRGLTPSVAEQLRETEQRHRIRKAAIHARQIELEQAKKQKPDMKTLLGELNDCWRRETEERSALLDKILSSPTMPRTSGGESTLKVFLDFAGDRETFLKQWGELAPDRRTAAGRSWDHYSLDVGSNSIGDHIFNAFKNNDSYGNPIQWLEANLESHGLLPDVVHHFRDDILRVRNEKPDKWFDLILTRTPDSADLVLFRNDGSEAGSFQKRDLSTGQKNTVILSLLLALGKGPVLIDQPEDELDSEFLFHELVPMLRKAKLQRQLIIVTHNANIPVNGDAELVLALEARGGRGECRTQGGLDRFDVTRSVLDIMEGSEDAFRRRQEKYHF